MTEKEIEMHHETLATFLDAIQGGGSIPNEVALSAWLSWIAIDTAVTEHLEGMKKTIADLETALYFERLPAGGIA